MKAFSYILLGLGLLFPIGCSHFMPDREPPATGQTLQKYSRLFARDIRYLLYLPEDYYQNANQRWPLVLFLHGAGERGADLNLVTKHGPPKLAAAGERFPFIILSPQCPEDRRWKSGPLKRLLDRVKLNFRVDESRLYLTGLSMGGYGTWHLAASYPEYFAAIAPICGAGDPERAAALRDVPVWAFHGAQDEVVPLDSQQQMVDTLKKAGGNVRFTIYPEAGHDSWTVTYDNPEFYKWLLSHRKGAR